MIKIVPIVAGPEPSGPTTVARGGTPASAATAPGGTPGPPDVSKPPRKVRAASPGGSAAGGAEGPGAAVMAALEGDEDALLEAKGQEVQGEQVGGGRSGSVV
jgi:hypothetical protein